MRDWKRFRSFLRYTEIQENNSIFEVLLTSRENTPRILRNRNI